jgi:hypothetical protein
LYFCLAGGLVGCVTSFIAYWGLGAFLWMPFFRQLRDYGMTVDDIGVAMGVVFCATRHRRGISGIDIAKPDSCAMDRACEAHFHLAEPGAGAVGGLAWSERHSSWARLG